MAWPLSAATHSISNLHLLVHVAVRTLALSPLRGDCASDVPLRALLTTSNALFLKRLALVLASADFPDLRSSYSCGIVKPVRTFFFFLVTQPADIFHEEFFKDGR